MGTSISLRFTFTHSGTVVCARVMLSQRIAEEKSTKADASNTIDIEHPSSVLISVSCSDSGQSDETEAIAGETFGECRIVVEIGRQNFERNRPIQPWLSHAIDKSHTTLTDEFFYLKLRKGSGDIGQRGCGFAESLGYLRVAQDAHRT